MFCAGVFLLTVALCPSRALSATDRPQLDAAALARLLRAGMAVRASDAVIRGDLNLGNVLGAPLVLHNCVLQGDLVGASTLFQGLVDLSGSSLRGDVDLSNATFEGALLLNDVHTAANRRMRFDYARFDGPAVFAGARLGGRVSFTGAQFRAASRFRGTYFHRPAGFDFAEFDHAAGFAAAKFFRAASFGGAEFHAVSDFTSTEFKAHAAFDTALFSGPAEFTGATFAAEQPNALPASFFGARFDGGATFTAVEFDKGATFDRAEAATEIDFDAADFEGPASFSAVRFPGRADFSHAEFHGFVNFDEAVIGRLDLDGASFAHQTVVLPRPKPKAGQIGHIDELRLDPNDVGHVRAGGSASDTRAARERALKLVESAASAGGDDHAAREAKVLLLTLERHDHNALWRAEDWAIYWGVMGYLVRPLHPLFVLVALILLVPLIRAARRRRLGWWAAVHDFPADLGASFFRAWKLKIGEGSLTEKIEALLYKLVILLFVLTLGNVSPTLKNLFGGLLP
jgi:uncharacterized protein YjbI with pentapeptide repeats